MDYYDEFQALLFDIEQMTGYLEILHEELTENECKEAKFQILVAKAELQLLIFMPFK